MQRMLGDVGPGRTWANIHNQLCDYCMVQMSMNALASPMELRSMERTASPEPMDEPEELSKSIEDCLNLIPSLDDIPQAVGFTMSSWIKNANTMAIIMSLFAAVQIILIQNLPPTEEKTGRLWNVTRGFMYAGIFLHLGGAISATVIMQMASGIPVRGRHAALTDSEKHLLAAWGLRGKFTGTAYHMVVCFVLGFISALVSILLWVWSSEGQRYALGGTLLPVALVAAATFLFAFLW
ncbi:1284_t:CDS:2 [Acaulospora colombiana]|uniref:1284_t:CDS:1 n=1 Tax=Acaulospora colombiana TaxID=27376 RepID=A0ACA9LRH2_9GLOM|nr:1284_t:CDS:2 [Acaulospora colombiana]